MERSRGKRRKGEVRTELDRTGGEERTEKERRGERKGGEEG